MKYKSTQIYTQKYASSLFELFLNYRIDGGCRHVAATLFEIEDFQNDQLKSSVTSGKCLWVKKSKTTTEPVMATGLNTSIINSDNHDKKPYVEMYNPIPATTPLPDPDEFFNMVKDNAPEACALDTWEVRPLPSVNTPDLPCLSIPQAKIQMFIA